MPTNGSETGTVGPVDRREGGSTWIAHPEETMQRASHALGVDGEVWLVDPVDVAGLDDHLADLGEVAGVVILLDRHKRDCETIATRHDVPVFVPEWMDGVAGEIDADVERFGTTLAETFQVYPIVNSRFWQEAALYDEDSGTLVVAESVGTVSYFTTGGRPLGVHPMRRHRPPRRLRQFDPERILVGHGPPVTTEASAAVTEALDGARRRAPRLYAESLRDLLFG
ncbi:hypothetical protein [Halorhabdus salina]|uniref:hypothetical protein n=1 Tax=Halorhabdus salina TaxID=2750670 RepID=UPI0015EF8AC3|nr:hypothetical protein [Halorhabdus salina]